MTTIKWDEARTQTLVNGIGNERPVSASTVETLASTLETSTRSVASKLRKLGYEVASMAKSATSAFTEEEAVSLQRFVTKREGQLTYTEIAEQWGDGKFNAKQIQGKLLSMELTKMVKPAEKVAVVHKYTEAEEAKLVEMCKAGAFVEDIAAALNKSTNSVRGKALSLLRSNTLDKIPSQKESHAKEKGDTLEGIDVANMTVAQLVEATGKTERGIRTMLTRRGLNCSDYSGEAKKAKAAAKEAV